MNTMIRIHLVLIGLVALTALVSVWQPVVRHKNDFPKEKNMSTPSSTLTRFEEMPIGTIVARQPATARVFEKYQLDYCCRGKRKLAEACEEDHIDLRRILAELDEATSLPASGPVWMDRSLAELCDHIEQRHHDYLREELPRIAGLIDKVINAHGESHPELTIVRDHFRLLRSELEPHMMKEERVLFPAIRQMESGQPWQSFPFGSVDNPIRCMVDEHEHAGEQLAILRELTAGYVAPDGACPTWRVMLDSLSRLERDMHEHVHKENSILFPRAQAVERQNAR
jgi:regulator of cell morphogenesis and NO signaling